jgi:hypothetical protein
MFNIFKKKPTTFLSDKRHIKNLQTQLAMAPKTLEQIRGCGIGENKELKLEFFFYTNTEIKAEQLGQVLVEKGYTCKYCESESDKNLFVITGWSYPIKMTHSDVVTWTGEMCVDGHRNDCEFDGWGTNPNQ